MVLKMLVAALGGAAGYVVGGPFGAAAIAGATEGAGVALDAMGDRFRRRAVFGAGHAVRTAADKSGLSYAELTAALTRDPETALLAATALNAAAETAMREKVLLMGRVLANAATDTAVVDDEFLFTRAMRLLEAPHFRMLSALNRPPIYEADTGGSATGRWMPAQLAAQLNWNRRSVTSVLLTLQGEAAAYLSPSVLDGGSASEFRDLMRARNPVDLGDLYCEITDFGAHLVERVEDARTEAEALEPPSRGAESTTN